jgi:hypothetical protein
MSYLAEKGKGQTSLEAIMITGAVITIIVICSSFFFGPVSKQTSAIIIVKTELLKEFGSLDKAYVLNPASSLEPVVLADGTLCFSVWVKPSFSDGDKASLNSKLGGIKQKVTDNSGYQNVSILLEQAC